MRYFLWTAVLAAFLISAPPAGAEGVEQDKVLHFTAGALIAQTSYPAFNRLVKNDLYAKLCAFGAALAISLAKEVADGKRFDTKDLAAGTLGGASVYLFQIEW